MKILDLKDTVAVITGGSRGIGKEIAFLFARNEIKVIICARNSDELKRVSDAIRGTGERCDYFAADVSDMKQVSDMAAEVIKNYGKVDILVNNAGVGLHKPFLELTVDDWALLIDTNLSGAFNCSQVFATFMVRQQRGFIINIASGAGRVGMKDLSAYCASKFGLIGLTESLKKELSEYGIEVTYLCPGFVKTGFFQESNPKFVVPPNARKPEEIARDVLRIVTHRNKVRRYIDKIVSRLL